MYRNDFYAGVDTDNLTEAFNNTLRSRYLGHRADTTVYSLVQVLVDVVFPEQAKEYTTALTQATESYRVPRYEVPPYLRNRPPKVQAAALRQLNLSKGYSSNDIKPYSLHGSYAVEDDKCNNVDIPKGLCSCYYFIKNRIPCKHMFAVFRHHNEWNWNSLPAALTESTYMVLDVDTGTTMTTCTMDQVVDKDQQPTFQSLPPKITSAHSLKLARRHLHDLLHKCTSVVYMNDNITDLQRATAMAENLYRELIGFATTSTPEIPVLVKSTMKRPQIQNKETQVKRSRMNEPLLRVKYQVGRPQKVTTSRHRPPLSLQVSQTTRILRKAREAFQKRTISGVGLKKHTSEEGKSQNFHEPPRDVAQAITMKSVKRLSLRRPDKPTSSLDKANLPHQPTTAIGHLNRRWKEIQHDRHIEQFGFTHDDEKLEIKSDSQHNTIQNDDGGVMLRANIMYGDKTDIKDEIDQEFALLDKIDSETETMWYVCIMHIIYHNDPQKILQLCNKQKRFVSTLRQAEQELSCNENIMM
jgi:hypothetical protein